MTLHDFRGPRLVPLQVSAVLVNAEELVRLIVSAALAEVPELERVNVCLAAWPTFSVP